MIEKAGMQLSDEGRQHGIKVPENFGPVAWQKLTEDVLGFTRIPTNPGVIANPARFVGSKSRHMQDFVKALQETEPELDVATVDSVLDPAPSQEFRRIDSMISYPQQPE
jgi:hypothetical protein